jgi:methionyl-tRNA synthetase
MAIQREERPAQKILVCTAWPYASDVPHLGNLIGSLLSGDVFTRYYKLTGHEAVHVSGTDAHGTKIEFEAFKRGIPPRELFEQVHAQILEILRGFDIGFETYTTTESPVHHRFVREISHQIEANGYIFAREEERVYCEHDHKFLADSFLGGTCPHCGFSQAQGNQCDNCGALLEPEELRNPTCRLCGQGKIIRKKTKNWYFDLQRLAPQLETYVAGRRWQDNVQHMSEGMLKLGLEPRAFTRDLEWGIPAPFAGAESKVLYVWAEAALGYVSATIEHFEQQAKPERWKEFWFGDNVKQIYAIGKDNIPFHALIFPGQLIASSQGYHLPDQIASTEYLNWIGGEKFSKSRKIGLFADDALRLLDGLYWRFYLLYARPERRDIEFSWEDLDKAINGVFVNNIGNLVNRVITLIHRRYEGRVPEAEIAPEIWTEIRKVKANVEETIEAGLLAPALREIAQLAVTGNEYVQKNQPWGGDKPKVIAGALQLIKTIVILLEPFVPRFSQGVYRMLGLEDPTLADILISDGGRALRPAELLIHPIDIAELRARYESEKSG